MYVFFQINGVNHVVVLYNWRIAIYKISESKTENYQNPWEDNDEKPEVERIDFKA